MEIQQAAAIQVLAMSLQGARSQVSQAQAAPAAAPADVILQLSTAAQSLLTIPRT
jgi:hypothetical protein